MDTPEQTREALIAELIEKHGFDRAGAEALLGQHEDVVEIPEGELEIRVEEQD